METRSRYHADEIESPAKSRRNGLSAKRGDTKVSDLQGASKDMYDSMSEDELEDFAKGERQGRQARRQG